VVSSLRPRKFAEHAVLGGGEPSPRARVATPGKKKNRGLVCWVRDGHHWTDSFWQDCQHGSLHEHFWRILCSTEEERQSRTERNATLLGCPCSDFMTSSLRNERLAKICGRHVLLTLQHATIFSGDTLKVRYTIQIRTRYTNWRTTSATQVEPSKSLFYIGCILTWLDVRSCVLMQEATTYINFYDGLSFQDLATALVSIFTLCYGPGLLFRGPLRILWGVERISSSLYSFLNFPVTSSRLGPNSLLSTLISNILIIRSSFNVSNHVSHPYKTTCKIIILYNLIFIFSDRKVEEKGVCT
jgi:hypothetical protein